MPPQCADSIIRPCAVGTVDPGENQTSGSVIDFRLLLETRVEVDGIMRCADKIAAIGRHAPCVGAGGDTGRHAGCIRGTDGEECKN